MKILLAITKVLWNWNPQYWLVKVYQKGKRNRTAVEWKLDLPLSLTKFPTICFCIVSFWVFFFCFNLNNISVGKMAYQVQVMDVCQNLQFCKKFIWCLHIHLFNCSFLQKGKSQVEVITWTFHLLQQISFRPVWSDFDEIGSNTSYKYVLSLKQILCSVHTHNVSTSFFLASNKIN